MENKFLKKAIEISLESIHRGGGPFGACVVRNVGEISNYKRNQSGHHYFSLKDSGAQITCVIWASTKIDSKINDGMKVIESGYVSL